MAKPKITYTATAPNGETVNITTTRVGINFIVFTWNDYSEMWAVTLSTATDAAKAQKSARSSVGAGYIGEFHVRPAQIAS